MSHEDDAVPVDLTCASSHQREPFNELNVNSCDIDSQSYTFYLVVKLFVFVVKDLHLM